MGTIVSSLPTVFDPLEDDGVTQPWTSPGSVAQRPPRLLLTLLGDYWWQRAEPLPSAAIVALLWFALRSLKRAALVLAPLVLAVLTVAAVLALCGVELTILHLVGMLLIVAVGSSYLLSRISGPRTSSMREVAALSARVS